MPTTEHKTIAILSGKGGTGKTLVSVNLAAVAGQATYIDCDVEEPDGNLYFRPKVDRSVRVTVKKPVVDQDACTGCHACVSHCAFNALALVGKQLMIFDEICHSCGLCALVCPVHALTEEDREIGTVETGSSVDVRTVCGTMDVGQSSGVPIVDALLAEKRTGTTFIDCPPGSSCMVMESIKDADFCLLVAEPTIFGVHNLAMVHELVCRMGKPHAAILNKCLEGEHLAKQFCEEHKIPVVGSIPFDPQLGALHSEALVASRENRTYRHLFSSILEAVCKEADDETVAVAQR
jgi:MinD superfamily P-loop ATPase